MKSPKKRASKSSGNLWLWGLIAFVLSAGAFIWFREKSQSQPQASPPAVYNPFSNSMPDVSATVSDAPTSRPLASNDLASLTTAAGEMIDAGRWPQAAALLTRAAKLDPADPDIPYNLGFALARMGNITNAVTAYRKALEIDPEYVEAYINLGNLYLSQREYYEATKHLSAALRLMPDHSTALNSMGKCLAGQGKTEEAMSYFSQAVLKNPAFVEARVNLGTALLSLGRNDEAVQEFSQAVQLDPNFRHAVEGLAEARRRQASGGNK